VIGIEGTGNFGAGLARFLLEAGENVKEVRLDRPDLIGVRAPGQDSNLRTALRRRVLYPLS
jgi:predicted dinucleotide-binding enzyme